MKLADRQALANALNSASRSGYRGVCEDITERTAWLTAPAVERQDGVPVWDPPRDCRFLVFTSAGDANNVSRWVRDRRDSDSFELCVCYYSSQAEPKCLRVIAWLTVACAQRVANSPICWRRCGSRQTSKSPHEPAIPVTQAKAVLTRASPRFSSNTSAASRWFSWRTTTC